MITIYTDSSHHEKQYRGMVFPLLKPFIGTDKKLTDHESLKMYGFRISDFALTDNLASSDIAVLPMSWNYYYKTRNIDKANHFISNAISTGKCILTWTSGDWGITPPYNEKLITLRLSGYADRHNANHVILPPPVIDPIDRFWGGDKDKVLKYQTANNNVIGFCGHASSSIKQHLSEILQIIYRNTLHLLSFNRSPFDRQAILSSTAMRNNILNQLENIAHIKTHFIRRERIEAGAKTPEEKITVANEYFNNMLESDFIICMRGTGNFSLRFFETLSMGRIPILIDTRTILPDIYPLQWKDHIIVIKQKELSRINEKIESFMYGKNMHEQRVKNRMVYEQFLGTTYWKDLLSKTITNITSAQ